MATTARVVEYSLALMLATNGVIETVLQLSLRMAAWVSVPDWLGPTAFELYVPVIAANFVVFRSPPVSRRRFWVVCLTTKVTSLCLFAPIFLASPLTGIYPDQHLLKAIAFLGAWLIAAALSYIFVTNDGYRRAYRRFEAQFRV